MNILSKKISGIFITAIIGISCVFGNILPSKTIDIPSDTIGVFQADKTIIIREKPDINSKILLNKEVIYKDLEDEKTSSLFSITVPKKELAYLYATDISDDENWVEVVYDKSEHKKGWIYKNDDFQFWSWVNFLNLYGRKYGLIRLENRVSPDIIIYSQPDDTAQKIGNATRPQSIRLTSIEGEWMLVTILDLSSNTVTGYIKWRDETGILLVFPNIQ